MGVKTLQKCGGSEKVGQQERLHRRSGSWYGPGVKGFTGTNCGGSGEGSWWVTSTEYLFQSPGLFLWKGERAYHFCFFLTILLLEFTMYCVPDIIPRAFYLNPLCLNHLIVKITVGSRSWNDPLLTEGETEAQRGEITHSRSRST